MPITIYVVRQWQTEISENEVVLFELTKDPRRQLWGVAPFVSMLEETAHVLLLHPPPPPPPSPLLLVHHHPLPPPPPPSPTTTTQAIPCNQIPKYLESNKYIMLQRCTITYIMQTYITHQCTQRDTSSVAFVKTLNHWPLGKYCGFKDIIYKVYTLLTIKIVSIELKKMSCCVFLKISLMILLKLTLVQIISRVSCQKGPTRQANMADRALLTGYPWYNGWVQSGIKLLAGPVLTKRHDILWCSMPQWVH